MAPEKKGWKEILPGGLTEAGSSAKFNTGDWRSKFPIVNEKCINCLQCVAYCPDECIAAKEGNMDGFNYDYCKGCGICASICPVKAISMHDETKFVEFDNDREGFKANVAKEATKVAPKTAPEKKVDNPKKIKKSANKTDKADDNDENFIEKK